MYVLWILENHYCLLCKLRLENVKAAKNEWMLWSGKALIMYDDDLGTSKVSVLG